MAVNDTIFANSSGAPPAGIAIIRISGPCARMALIALAGHLPPPRKASYRTLHDDTGAVLDQALVLWLPGPTTATGEDTAELHCHGGRAVVAAVLAVLARLPQLRAALPGEFTRRGFLNGRMDLAEAEGLADLLSAETELQRQSALVLAGGGVSRQVMDWRDRLLNLSAMLEAALDFSDEDDVGTLPDSFTWNIATLRGEMRDWLNRPRAEALKEGFRVVIAGPPNAGKSTLFNALVESEAAITAPIAGTTRDVLTRPVAISGVPFQFADTAGMRDAAGDRIEAMGIARAKAAVRDADLVLWLGPEGEGPDGAWEIEAQIDRADHVKKYAAHHRVSAMTGEGIDDVRRALVARAHDALPKPGEAALNARQHGLLAAAETTLAAMDDVHDPLLLAEHLRLARSDFDALLGRTTTEDMLDALFGRFCIGK